MKKSICIFLSLLVLVLLCGCGDSATGSLTFDQQVTVVRMPSPPKCKTTDQSNVVNEVVNILGLIEKTPIVSDDVNGGWDFMIKLSIDGQVFNYSVGTVFTDSDGRQYNVTNYDLIKTKLTELYDKIDVEEVDYT